MRTVSVLIARYGARMTTQQIQIDWTRELLDQLEWHWTHHLRPRLDSLTDDEYLWEPVRDSTACAAM